MEQVENFQHLMCLFFLGQLVGLPTLKSILTKFHIGVQYHPNTYRNICKYLTINKIRRIFEFVFETYIETELTKLCQKDSSAWSRELVTVVLDDSVFKQWIQEVEAEFASYYQRFFSGQYRSVVSGFKVLTLGVSIDGVFYPLYLEFIKKNEQGKSEKCPKVAIKLLDRWANFRDRFGKKGLILPPLHLSCDNGYSDVALSEKADNVNLIYISVPKKSHNFEINGEKMKLSEAIKRFFLPAETLHDKQQADLPTDKQKKFVLRIKANYCCQKNREVVLLLFRLNGSKKVTAIYCSNNINIFAKTLRRHWFQRTYIEQFFKTLKHVLKIQEARTSKKMTFEIKLVRFMFMAIHVQKLVKFLRKKSRGAFDGKGFIAIQRLVNHEKYFLDLLQKKILVKY